MSCQEDIFTILDVSLREDSYTRLIKAVLDQDEDLRRKVFCALARRAGKHLDSLTRVCEPRFRQQFPAGAGASGAETTKDKPDLLLCGTVNGEQFWIVLEAKIAAGEGDGQLQRYRVICEKCLPGRYLLFFLTLVPMEPSTKEAQNILHGDLAGLIDHHMVQPILRERPELGTAWKAYGRRLEELKQCGLTSDVKLRDYYGRQERGFDIQLFRDHFLAQFLADALNKKASLGGSPDEERCWKSGVWSDATTRVLQFWLPSWLKEQALLAANGGDREGIGVQSFFELKIPYKSNWEGLSLVLQFATLPYLSRGPLAARGAHLLDDFDQARLAFRDQVHGYLGAGGNAANRLSVWRLTSYPLQVAKAELRLNASPTAKDLEETIVGAICSLAEVVDEAMSRV